MYWALGDKLGTALNVERLAAVAGAQGEAVRAARLFGAAVAVCDTLDVVLSSFDRLAHSHAIAVAHAHVSERTWTAAWADGQAMSLGQAVAYAMEGNESCGVVGKTIATDRNRPC